MVIEYIGELIRNEVANRREKQYQEQVNKKTLKIYIYIFILIIYYF